MGSASESRHAAHRSRVSKNFFSLSWQRDYGGTPLPLGCQLQPTRME